MQNKPRMIGGRSTIDIRTSLALAICLACLSSCGPKVDTSSPFTFDDDDPLQTHSDGNDDLADVEIERTRSGTISRSELAEVVEDGVGKFLTLLEVEADRVGNRFIGWRIIRFDNAWIDLIAGDTVKSVNGSRIETPDQVQALWLSLNNAREISILAMREGTEFELKFSIAGTKTSPPNRPTNDALHSTPNR